MARKPINEVDIDDMKSGTDEHTARVIEEKSNKLLEIVKEYETEENYWFVKYYLSQCFAIFTMGGMSACMNENAWIKPDEEIDEAMKKNILNLIANFINKELLAIFDGHEDLLVRIFGYGTHCAQMDFQEAREED